MSQIQEGILAPIPSQARYLFFTVTRESELRHALTNLQAFADGVTSLIGFGSPLIQGLSQEISGLTTFPAYTGPGFTIPSTPTAMWCWLRGDDRGELVHRTHDIAGCVAPALQLTQAVDAFRYRSGFDLFGYEDGTENPNGADAIKAGVVTGRGLGLDGGSFVAVQQWVHDLASFRRATSCVQDSTIGRRKRDNEELPDAPSSAHVKRTAQESFDPTAFILRRSMPWAEAQQAGLMFVAFGRSLDAFEALLRRMVGVDDGIVDALFAFTRPVSGSYFWCPPMENGRLDLRALGLPA